MSCLFPCGSEKPQREVAEEVHLIDHLFVLFSKYTSRDIPKKIVLFSLRNLCVHLHVQKMKFQRNCSLGNQHVVCIGQSKCTGFLHFCCFLAKTIQKSFFLTFTRAEIIALKFRAKTSINFSQKSNPWYMFGFALEMSTRSLKI